MAKLLKRIWALVGSRDFYGVQKKAREDGVSMGEALAQLAHMYATGRVELNAKRIIEHRKQNTGVDYVAERRLIDVDPSLTGGQ